MPLRHRLIRCALALLLAAGGAARADDAADVQALLAGGDAATALRRVERALAARPDDAQLRFLHGVVLMDLRRDEEALTVFTQLAQLYPELPDPLNNIALLQARAGRLELARQALEAALRNDPGHRLARANLGQVHLMLAVQAWEQAAAGGPLEPSMQRLLDGARALLASGAAAAR
jgi:Flp pilus assembly protein TadD